MSAAPVILYLDTTHKRLVSSFLSNIAPFSGLSFEAGDTVPIQLHFLQANNASGTAGQLPFSYIDPSTVTPVSLAVGTIGLAPTAGTFTVAWNTSTSSALPFNCTATALQTAINGLAGIPSGGVTVVGANGGPWTVTFNTAGAVSFELVINASELVPVSQGITQVAIAGASGVQEQEVLFLLQSPAALQNTWTTNYGAATVIELVAGGSGINEVQRIAIPQGTYGGSYSISFGGKSSGAIPYNASASVVQAALVAMSSIGAGNAQVILSSPVTWDVTFTGSLAGASQALMAVVATGLQMPMFLSASLSLNTTGIFSLLAGGSSAQATVQIQQGTSGSINTVLQQSATIAGTLILGTPSVPVAANPWQTLSQVLALIATPANLPVATSSVVGAVSPDGTIITVSGAGAITVAKASSSAFGVVKVDGTTIVSAAGIISAVGSSFRVATNFTATSSIALANITGLSAAVAAAGTYSFEAVIFTTAAAAGGVQLAIAGTATATAIEYEGQLTSAAALVAQTRATALAGVVCSNASATAGTAWITGTIVVNAGGTLTVQFAQNTSNASASTVLAGSWFRVWPTAN